MQRGGDLCEQRNEHPRRDRDGPRKAEMEARCAERDDGADHHRPPLLLHAQRDAAADLARLHRVGAERQVRPVRFRCADGQKDQPRARDSRLDLLAGHLRERGGALLDVEHAARGGIRLILPHPASPLAASRLRAWPAPAVLSRRCKAWGGASVSPRSSCARGSPAYRHGSGARRRPPSPCVQSGGRRGCSRSAGGAG
jgi:hypothetical protein